MYETIWFRVKWSNIVDSRYFMLSAKQNQINYLLILLISSYSNCLLDWRLQNILQVLRRHPLHSPPAGVGTPIWRTNFPRQVHRTHIRWMAVFVKTILFRIQFWDRKVVYEEEVKVWQIFIFIYKMQKQQKKKSLNLKSWMNNFFSKLTILLNMIF